MNDINSFMRMLLSLLNQEGACATDYKLFNPMRSTRELILEPIDYLQLYEQDPKQFSNVEIIPPDMALYPFGRIKVEFRDPLPLIENWRPGTNISKNDHSKLQHV